MSHLECSEPDKKFKNRKPSYQIDEKLRNKNFSTWNLQVGLRVSWSRRKFFSKIINKKKKTGSIQPPSPPIKTKVKNKDTHRKSCILKNVSYQKAQLIV